MRKEKEPENSLENGTVLVRDDPESLIGEFAVTWEFPTVEPPDYLRRLNPALHEHECQGVQQRFQDAVTLVEQAFLDELTRLVNHLTE